MQYGIFGCVSSRRALATDAGVPRSPGQRGPSGSAKGCVCVPRTPRSGPAAAGGGSAPLPGGLRRPGRAAAQGMRLLRMLPPLRRSPPAVGDTGGAGRGRSWRRRAGSGSGSAAQCGAERPAARSRAGRSSAERSGAAAPRGLQALRGCFGGAGGAGAGPLSLPDGIHLSAGAASPRTAGGTVSRREPALSRERTGMTF